MMIKKSLTRSISQVVRCHNRLFEFLNANICYAWDQKKHMLRWSQRCDNGLFEQRWKRKPMLHVRLEDSETYDSVVATPPQVSKPNLIEGPTSIEIETTRRQGSLCDTEKQWLHVNSLCLYCGGPRHIVVNCPHKPTHQVYRVSAHDNPISSSIITSNNLSKPTTHAMRIYSMSSAN